MLIPKEKEYVLDMICEIAQKIRDLEIQVDNLVCYIADDDEFPSNDAQ